MMIDGTYPIQTTVSNSNQELILLMKQLRTLRAAIKPLEAVHPTNGLFIDIYT